MEPEKGPFKEDIDLYRSLECTAEITHRVQKLGGQASRSFESISKQGTHLAYNRVPV